jgi:hypothetical protein
MVGKSAEIGLARQEFNLNHPDIEYGKIQGGFETASLGLLGIALASHALQSFWKERKY